jgi:hypothetical protein
VARAGNVGADRRRILASTLLLAVALALGLAANARATVVLRNDHFFERTTAEPTLVAPGGVLSWNAIDPTNSYLIRRKIAGHPSEYAIVKGTSALPPAVPEAKVSYSVTAILGSRWSPEVSITYPSAASAGSAAALTTALTSNTLLVELREGRFFERTTAQAVIAVAGETLSWDAIDPTHFYVLRRKLPGQPAEYALVKSLSVLPPVLAGRTVVYTVKPVLGSWSSEVSIAYEQEEGFSLETWEEFSALNPMPAGRTPGNASSPFNQRIEEPVVLPNSSEMVAWLLSQHVSSQAMPGTDRLPNGGSRPMYYASNTDPVVELRVTESWGSNSLQGRMIRVPVKAAAEEASDGHFTIVLAPVDAKVPGETVDMWRAKPVSEGKLSFAWGGPGNITGTLVQPGHSADAAGFDLEAGLVRGPELKAGAIPHALVAAIKDTKPTFVFPASHTDGKSSELAAPAMGQRFYLAYSDAEINALPVAPWKKAILTALAHYGFYVGDSGDETISFVWEGSLMYTPFGAPEPFSEIGKEQGVPKDSAGKYIFNLSEGVDWTRLRAIAPPVS